MGRVHGALSSTVGISRPRPGSFPRIWRATDRPRSGTACTTAARRSASPSGRRRVRRTASSCCEEGQLQMSLLGATTAAAMRTSARVDASFELKSFEFSLDPGTGAIKVHGTVERPSPSSAARRVTVEIASGGDTRTQVIELAEPPAMTLNFSRMLANAGLVPGSTAQMDDVRPGDADQCAGRSRRREPRSGQGRRYERARRSACEMTFKGLQTMAWVTDTGEVVREESPLGIDDHPRAGRDGAPPRGVRGACRPTCCGCPRSCRS